MNESSVLVRLRLLGGQAFAAGAKRDAAALGEMGGAAAAAGTKMKGVAGAMGVAGGAIAGVTRLVKRLAFPLLAIAGVSGKMAMDYQQAMELVHTQTGATQGEVDRLSVSVLNLAKHAKQSPLELANALYRLEGAGIRGAKAMTALKAASDLAAVGNADVEDTAKTLAQVWFSGIKGAGNMRKVVAELNATVGAGDLRLQQLVDALGVGIMPVARNVGLRMRDITGALALFGDETNNVSGWTAQLATALHFLYNPTTKAETAMESIGITGTRMAKDLRKPQGLLTAMRDLRGHLNKLPGGFRGVKASQVLGAILPGGRGRVLNVLMGQLDRYQQKLKQVGDTTGRFGDAVRKTQETAAFKVHAAWSTIQADLIQLGRHVLPIAAGGFTLLARGVDKLTGKLQQLSRSHFAKTVKGIASSLGHGVSTAVQTARRGDPRTQRNTVASAQPMLQTAPNMLLGGGVPKQLSGWQKVGLVIRGVFNWIGRTLPKVGGTIAKYGGQLLEAFKPAAPFLQNVILPLLKGLSIGVVGGVVTAFKILIPVIRITATVLGFIGKVLAPVKGAFVALGAVLGFLFGGEILDALAVFGKIGTVFRVMALPIRIVNGLFSRIGGVILRVARFFGAAQLGILRFVSTFQTSPARAARAALNLVGAIFHVMETMPERMAQFGLAAGRQIAAKLPAGVRGKLGGIVSFFGRVGKAILDAIVNAIKSAPGMIVGAITSIVPDKLKGVVKRLFPGLASGGLVSRGGVRLVGERGPELAAFPSGTRVYNADQTRRAVTPIAGEAPIYLTANLHMSGKQIHHEVFKIDRSLAEAT